MALANGKTVTKSTSGYSDHILLPKGEHALLVTSGGWGGVTLQVGDPSGTNFVDLKDSNGVVSLTANGTTVVVGGLAYRMNVTSYSAAVTLTAYPTNG